MAHRLQITIEIEDTYSDNEGGSDIVKKLCSELTKDSPRNISFEELDKMFFLGARQYHVKNVDFCDYDLSNKDIITKIEING
jgi:hypothetical protein